MKEKFFITAAIMMFSFGIAVAQSTSDKMPQDPKVTKGKLANGMTYYLRHNEEPKGQASFYIIRNAGAILEDDNQNGLAHFLEHMAFQGTKNFPGKGIIETLQRHGVAFGENLNAYTAQDETVYNISNVPISDKTVVDTCLMILHDWAYYLTLDEKEIDDERGVISEEWRTRRTSQFRIRAQMMPTLMKGSKYAERDVIGDLNIIKTFKPETIRKFYHDWYRTDLCAVAIVGDFDIKEVEAKLIKILEPIPAVENPMERKTYGIPSHDETYYVCATDKEATNSSVQIYSILPSSKTPKDSYGTIRESFIESFYQMMVSIRLREIMQQPNPPYLGGAFGPSKYIRNYNVFAINTTAKPNEEAKALKTILTEYERVKRFGFTDGELQRIKTMALAQLDMIKSQIDKTDNESYIADMQSNFLEGEAMVSFEDTYKYAKKIIPTITVEEIAEAAKAWYTDKNKTVIVTGPENVKHLTKEEAFAIIDEASKDNSITAYSDNSVTKELLNANEVKGGSIVKTKHNELMKTTEWTLSNGAKVYFRHADYEKDQIALSGTSQGGTSLYDIALLPSAGNTINVASGSGLGEFNAIELQKVLAGKMASCNVGISGAGESVGGSSNKKDLETMFQLLYMRFQMPRFDEDIYKSLINRSLASVDASMHNPQKIMGDSVKMIASNYNPRVLLYNRDYINKINFEDIKKVYLDRIKDASDFTFFIVGDTDEETLAPLVAKYIGAIPSYKRHETWKDNKVRAPKGITEKIIPIKMQDPKSTVLIQFSKEMKTSDYLGACSSVLKDILDFRYTANIREKEGGTYGVGVSNGASAKPISQYTMSMNFDCDPAKAEHLKTLIYSEIENIKENGVTKEEISKSVANTLKNMEQSKDHNSYWMSVISTYYLNKKKNIDDPKNGVDILKALTPEDIVKFAKKQFDNPDIIDIIFTPEK